MVFTRLLPSCEIDSEESVQPLDPFQLHVPALQECRIGTAGYEFAYDTGYKDFAAMCVAGDPGGVVDSRAEEIVGFAKSVTSMNANPNAQWRRSIRELAGNALLDRPRT